MRYARMDENGIVIETITWPPEGRYTDEVVPLFQPVPEEVEQGWRLDHESGAWTNPNIYTLTDAKVAKLSEINAACQIALESLTPTYPERELTTFDKQESEARAYLADTTASTPLLSALAAARGIELADLVQRVIAKADAFAAASGAIIGQRQALEDRLDAAQTLEDVQAITVA